MISNADAVIRLLDLQPLTIEGGWFRESYRSSSRVEGNEGSERPLATAIYYLLTPETFSELHCLPGDEMYHFYLGDAVEMVHLRPDGTIGRPVMGPAIESGERVQLVVPGGWWQGTKLSRGGKFALLGTTMSPGFSYDDYERGDPNDLIRRYPDAIDDIQRLTRSGTT